MQPSQPMQTPMPPTYGTMPPAAPIVAPMPVGGGGAGVSKWLSVVALLLAVAALAMSVAVPGPTGATGATGPQGPAGTNGTDGTDGTDGAQGPPGPGSLIVTSSYFSYGTINAACTNYAGAEVTITVPGPGRILVSGHVLGRMDHTAGNSLWMYVYVEGSVLCNNNNYGGYMSVDSVQPTGMYFDTIPVMNPFGVVTAGTYTFVVNAECGGLGGSCLLLQSALTAVFYPS